MLYCERSESKEYSLEKIEQRMAVLREEIPKVALLPATEEEEDIINGLNLNHPVTELIIELNALIIWKENPPDPRGWKMFCRVPPYFIHVSTKDLALAVGLGYKTVERAKRLAHKKLGLKRSADVTVDEFCQEFEYTQKDIDNVHQNLAYIREGKWKKLIDLQKKKKIEDE